MTSMTSTRRTRTLTLLGVSALIAVGGCAGSGDTATSAGDDITVGVVMVGSAQDAGYNQAVADAATALDDADGVTVITADQVAENNSVTDTMQSMADQGATVVFATSYGYFEYALAFAEDNPEVTVLHQGGFHSGEFPENFGTYWGAAYEPVSLGGMAAGAATESDRLGFVYAFPIAQTIANINAFHLGAVSVNPDAETYLVNTSDWCDPIKQQDAVRALLSEGVDVFSQHQDCQSTVVQAAKEADAKVVGYHYDANELAGEAWLTGSAWDWAPVMTAIVDAVRAGEFTGSEYNANWLGTFADGNNPLGLASFGDAVDPGVQDEITAEQEALGQPDGGVFSGPILCQDGSELVAEGEIASYEDVNAFDCLVEGVVGSLPRS